MKKGNKNSAGASNKTRSRRSKNVPQKTPVRRKSVGSCASMWLAKRPSLLAFANLKVICEEHLKGKYQLEVIDLLKNPQLAKGDQIVALPTLVRRLPEPVRKIIGHMSDVEKVLVGLQLRPRGSEDK